MRKLLLLLCLLSRTSAWVQPRNAPKRHARSQTRLSLAATPVTYNNTVTLTNLPLDVQNQDNEGINNKPIAVEPLELPLVQLALAGSVTTFFADMSMHPFDTIKTFQQANSVSMWTATTSLWETTGLAAFFAGFLVYACADAVSGALKFSVWEVYKKQTASTTFWALSLGAALACVASSATLVPGELVKNQLQVGHFDSVVQGVTSILTESGIGGFYTGTEAVLYRDIPYTILELSLYDVFKRWVVESRAKQSAETSITRTTTTTLGPMDEILAAAVTGAVTAVLTTPLDTIKCKMMVDPTYADMNFADTLLAVVQDHGPLAVFVGVLARVAWIVPFTVIYLPTYDALKRLLLERHVRHVETSSSP